MATKFKHSHSTVRTPSRRPHLKVIVTAADMRREHEEALRHGPRHPGYVQAIYLIQSVQNAYDSFGEGTIEELMEITFEARAETRNRHLSTI